MELESIAGLLMSLLFIAFGAFGLLMYSIQKLDYGT